jgi:hypothetical protein
MLGDTEIQFVNKQEFILKLTSALFAAVGEMRS